MRDAAGLFVAFLLVLAGLGVAVLLAVLPGQIAKRRGHANADAIRMCGIVGVVVWPCWLVALIWAYSGPDRGRTLRAAPVGTRAGGRPLNDPIPPNWGKDLDAEVERAMRRKP